MHHPRDAWDEDQQTYVVAGAPLALPNAGAVYRASRGRDDSIPGLHDTIEWENVDVDELDELGETLPACPGDLNNDGVVDVADLVEVILHWGSCD